MPVGKIMTDPHVRHFTQGQIKKITRILGDTQTGLIASEIGPMLASCKIDDIDSQNTKWKRLYNAFVVKHNKVGSDKFILGFISKALKPSRFCGNLDRFRYLASQINIVLSFSGLEFQEDGKFQKITASKTLSKAEYRVNIMKKIIVERNLHHLLYEYCKTELLDHNYFHAVLESVKGVASLLREKSGLSTDGAELVKESLLGENPKLRINSFITETEKSEQRGFSNLLIGIFGTFRNPTVHAAKIEWEIEEQDAMDLFTMVSYAMRRISDAKLR